MNQFKEPNLPGLSQSKTPPWDPNFGKDEQKARAKSIEDVPPAPSRREKLNTWSKEKFVPMCRKGLNVYGNGVNKAYAKVNAFAKDTPRHIHFVMDVIVAVLLIQYAFVYEATQFVLGQNKMVWFGIAIGVLFGFGRFRQVRYAFLVGILVVFGFALDDALATYMNLMVMDRRALHVVALAITLGFAVVLTIWLTTRHIERKAKLDAEAVEVPKENKPFTGMSLHMDKRLNDYNEFDANTGEKYQMARAKEVTRRLGVTATGAWTSIVEPGADKLH